MNAMLKNAIILLMVLPVLAQAQPVRTTNFQMNGPVLKTIVKELSRPTTISYVETSTEHLFVYNNGNLLLTSVPIDYQYSVSDFVVLGPNVYFCGNKAGGEVFFGSFVINPFFFTNQDYQTIDGPLNTVSSVVVRLNKMVAYNGNGVTELVAVGKTALGRDCVVELKDSAATMKYRVGELDVNSADNIVDITVTDDYVVTAGVRTYVNNSFPCVRLYYKNDIFANDTLSLGLQDTSYGFYYNHIDNPGDTHYSFDKSQLVLAPVKTNMFLLSAFWKVFKYYTQTLSENKGVAISYYDILPTLPPQVNHHKTTLVKQPYYKGGWKLRGVTQPTFAPATPSFFYLLQDAEVTGMNQPVSMMLDLSPSIFNPYAPSNVPAHYSRDAEYHRINGYNNNIQCLMSGRSLVDNTYLKYCEGTNGQYLCMPETEFPIIIVEPNERFILDPLSETGYVPIGFSPKTGGTPELIHGWIECPGKDANQEEEEER